MTHSDKSQKNWTFTSLKNDSLLQDFQLSEKTSTNLLTPRKLLLLRKRIWKNQKMQKIVLFIEPTEDAFETPFKSGHLFMNRFSIEEEANFEIVNILELGKSSLKKSWPDHSEYSNFEENRNQKGMSLSTLILFLVGTRLD